MAERTLYSPDSDPMPTGIAFLGQYHDRLKLLFDTAVLPLTAVGGTADAVTATLDPPLNAGLISGMKFGITWPSTNTGGVTLALNGGTPVPVLDAVGSALIAGAITAGQRSLIEYVAGAFRLIGAGSAEARALPYFEQITTSRTFVKPPGYADNTPVLIEAWGGGASGAWWNSGGTAAGGPGGRYAARRMRYADLPSSVSILIGAGGAPRSTTGGHNNGGDTTVGSLLIAYGGGTSGGSVSDGTLWKGGAGGAATGGAGGAAVFGGAGGAGTGPGATAGQSQFGGNGGSTGTSGVAPGGGGGGQIISPSGAGARGEVRIWIGG